MSAPEKLSGTLMLDHETVKTLPGFFALLALVLRASGLTVVALGQPGDDKRMAQAGIGFSDFKLIPAPGREAKLAKFNWAMHFLKASPPVIWVDVDFGSWGKEFPNANVPGLTTLNWAAVAIDGVKGKGVMQG